MGAHHHIVRSFDEELKYLEKGIMDMGQHAQIMVKQAIEAILEGDQNLAAETIAQDHILDKAERDLGEKAIMIIARRQPMAVDLREVIGTIRIASDIERIGDMAKNIAKRSLRITQNAQLPNFYRSLESFSVLALEQQRAALEAYASRSLEQIHLVHAQDDKIDAMYTSIFRELLTYMMEDSSKITACTNLLFCAKNIERMGDYVTNIAETLYYMVTGGYLSSLTRPAKDSVRTSGFRAEGDIIEVTQTSPLEKDSSSLEEDLAATKAKSQKKPRAKTKS